MLVFELFNFAFTIINHIVLLKYVYKYESHYARCASENDKPSLLKYVQNLDDIKKIYENLTRNVIKITNDHKDDKFDGCVVYLSSYKIKKILFEDLQHWDLNIYCQTFFNFACVSFMIRKERLSELDDKIENYIEKLYKLESRKSNHLTLYFDEEQFRGTTEFSPEKIYEILLRLKFNEIYRSFSKYYEYSDLIYRYFSFLITDQIFNFFEHGVEKCLLGLITENYKVHRDKIEFFDLCSIFTSPQLTYMTEIDSQFNRELNQRIEKEGNFTVLRIMPDIMKETSGFKQSLQNLYQTSQKNALLRKIHLLLKSDLELKWDCSEPFEFKIGCKIVDQFFSLCNLINAEEKIRKYVKYQEIDTIYIIREFYCNLGFKSFIFAQAALKFEVLLITQIKKNLSMLDGNFELNINKIKENLEICLQKKLFIPIGDRIEPLDSNLKLMIRHINFNAISKRIEDARVPKDDFYQLINVVFPEFYNEDEKKAIFDRLEPNLFFNSLRIAKKGLKRKMI